MTEENNLLRQREKSNKTIPLYFLYFFLIIALIDGILVYVSLHNWRGLVTDESYVEGLNYNETLSAIRRQDSLKWHSEFTFIPLGELSGQIQLIISDRNGNPIEQAEVIAILQHSLQAGDDQELELVEQKAGQYITNFTTHLSGKWLVKILVSKDQEEYQIIERIHL